MRKALCTMPGKSGDILWALPTVREISRMVGEEVDLAIMPYYKNLVPLLNEQQYINKAFVFEYWLRTHSNYGEQPWEVTGHATEMAGYEHVFHLGFRGHPWLLKNDMPLIDFIAWQQGIALRGQVTPFITVEEPEQWLKDGLGTTAERLVVYGFNDQYAQEKNDFIETFKVSAPEITFMDLTKFSWRHAAWLITQAKDFIGDRSGNWVLAQGLGKSCIIYEPHPGRHSSGKLGKTFGNPYGRELVFPLKMTACEAARLAVKIIKK